jgi:uncharacterized membrane protein YphA (DoxX/SURF4 family)
MGSRARQAPREDPLQRLFSTFPNRWPGLGLLLLRCAVGYAAIIQAAGCLATAAASDWQSWTLAIISIGAGFLLIVGLITPLASALVLTCYSGLASTLPLVPSHASGAAVIQTIAGAVSLALLGPGAFSLDSRLFGRREIIIPDSTPMGPA